MRVRSLLPLVAGASLVAPATASAYFAHVVTPGESLISVAATDGLSIAQLAAANGLSTGAQLIAGSTLMIPPQGSSSVLSSAGASTASTAVGDGDGDSDDVGGATESASGSSSAASSSGGSYIVQPGDTLSA